MSGKGGVDKKPIGGFKDAKSKYEQKANSGAASKAAPKKADAAKADAASGTGGGQGALFASINSGHANLTKGLNKVTSDMKTKNQKDRSGKVSSQPAKAKKNYNFKNKDNDEKKDEKPASVKANGNNIFIHNYKNIAPKALIIGGTAQNDNEFTIDKDVNLDQLQRKQFSFTDCSMGNFMIREKCGGVALENCSNIGVEVKSVVRVIDIAKCKKVYLKVTESAGSIVLESCEEVHIILSNKAAENNPPTIFTTTCKSTEFIIEGATEDVDPSNVFIPNQFETRKVNGEWETVPVKLE